MPKITQLSPLTTKYIKLQKPKAKDISTSTPKPDKKKLVCSTIAAIGLVGLAFGVVHHKKIQKPLKTTKSDFEKGVKKFFNNGNSIIGIKLEKGVAKNADGSGFSGVMKTMNNKNEKITLEYVDGYVKKSTKNEKLFKTFDYSLSSNGQKIVEINTFNETKSKTQLKFHNNGKIAKIIKPKSASEVDINKKGDKILEFSIDGKKLSDIETRECLGIEKATFYSKDGKTAERKLITKDQGSNRGSIYEETSFLNGLPIRQKTSPYGINTGFDVDINSDTFRQTMNTPKIVKLFKDGKPTKGIITSKNDGVVFLKDLVDEKTVDDFRISKYLKEPNLSLSTQNNKTNTFKKLTLENNEWTNGEIEKDILPYSKEELLEKADELDEAIKILQEDNILANEKGKQEGDFDLYPEKFTNYIQKIRTFAKSLK